MASDEKGLETCEDHGWYSVPARPLPSKDEGEYKPPSCVGCAISCRGQCWMRWPETPERLIKNYLNLLPEKQDWNRFQVLSVGSVTMSGDEGRQQYYRTSVVGEVDCPTLVDKRRRLSQDNHAAYNAHFRT